MEFLVIIILSIIITNIKDFYLSVLNRYYTCDYLDFDFISEMSPTRCVHRIV